MMGRALNLAKGSSFLSEAESLPAMPWEGPWVPGLCENSNVAEGNICTLR